jgi:ORF6N domain
MQLSVIQNKIYEVRGQKVMFDRDLATMYEVETRVLNQAVRRNIERFPSDFMFQLSDKEFENWKSQIVISNSEKMGLRKRPLAFTEQGVAMLSSVLNSKKAIDVNIAIIRTFVIIRQMAVEHKDLNEKIIKLEKKYNKNFKEVFKALEYLVAEKQHAEDINDRRRIGFKP